MRKTFRTVVRRCPRTIMALSFGSESRPAELRDRRRWHRPGVVSSLRRHQLDVK
jgi:hypothetical protein